jgi:hypothetical protein
VDIHEVDAGMGEADQHLIRGGRRHRDVAAHEDFGAAVAVDLDGLQRIPRAVI